MSLAVYNHGGVSNVGKRFSVGEELCRLDDVRMRMHFILYR